MHEDAWGYGYWLLILVHEPHLQYPHYSLDLEDGSGGQSCEVDVLLFVAERSFLDQSQPARTMFIQIPKEARELYS